MFKHKQKIRNKKKNKDNNSYSSSNRK